MLLDTKNPYWQRQVKADPFTLENLIAWLEKRDPWERYIVMDVDHCLLGQFAFAMGASDPGKKSLELGDITPFDDVAFKGAPSFGAALERARALVPSN